MRSRGGKKKKVKGWDQVKEMDFLRRADARRKYKSMIND